MWACGGGGMGDQRAGDWAALKAGAWCQVWAGQAKQNHALPLSAHRVQWVGGRAAERQSGRAAEMGPALASGVSSSPRSVTAWVAASTWLDSDLILMGRACSRGGGGQRVCVQARWAQLAGGQVGRRPEAGRAWQRCRQVVGAPGRRLGTGLGSRGDLEGLAVVGQGERAARLPHLLGGLERLDAVEGGTEVGLEGLPASAAGWVASEEREQTWSMGAGAHAGNGGAGVPGNVRTGGLTERGGGPHPVHPLGRLQLVVGNLGLHESAQGSRYCGGQRGRSVQAGLGAEAAKTQ